METPTPAPAPTPEPTISAGMDAATRGDFSAFDAAHTATKLGKPLPAVEAPEADDAPVGTAAAAPVSGEPPRTLSKRQQDTNDKIRQAVERATADSAAKIRELEARISAPPAAPREAPVAPAQPKAQEDWERLSSLPNAPKLANFDSVEDHTAAMSVFVARTLHAEEQQAAAQRTEREQISGAEQQRVDGFVSRLEAAKTADPEFVAKLTPEALALKPFGALAKGEASGPRNVIAEQLFDSSVAPQILLHFSQQPDALKTLETMPAAIAALPPALRTRAHIQHIVKEFAKLETRFETASAAPDPPVAAPSSITAAPPPAPTLNRTGSASDPKASAVARGDFAAFDRLEQASRAQRRARA